MSKRAEIAAKNAALGQTAELPREERMARRRKALEAHLAGHNYQVIADRLGYKTRHHARKDVQAALKSTEHLADLKEEIAAAEARTLALLAAIWAPARSGDLKAINTALKIMARIDQQRLLRMELAGQEPDEEPEDEAPVDGPIADVIPLNLAAI